MSIPFEPEELFRTDDGIGVTARRSGKVSERAVDGGRGLQLKPVFVQLSTRSFVERGRDSVRPRTAKGPQGFGLRQSSGAFDSLALVCKLRSGWRKATTLLAST